MGKIIDDPRWKKWRVLFFLVWLVWLLIRVIFMLVSSKRRICKEDTKN